MEESINNIIETEKEDNKRKIKYIVLSGGGVYGYAFYGLLRESNKFGLWNIDDIKGIYGTSVGSLLATIICLRFNWNDIDEYLIKRPWQNVYNIDMYSLIDIFQKMGIFEKKIIEESLYPLFNAMEIPHDVTMKDFYEITKIDLHIYVTELNSFTLYDINHIDYPNWKLVDAVYSSCAVPILFKPLIEDDKYFVDGGMIANYPVDHCLKVAEHPDEILAICKKVGQNNSKITNPFVENSKFLDFLLTVFSRSFEKIITNPYNFDLKHQYMIDIPNITLYDIINVSSSKEERIKLIDMGASFYKK